MEELNLQELNDKYCNKFILIDEDADGGQLLWLDKIFIKDNELVVNGIQILFIGAVAVGYGGVEVHEIEEISFDEFSETIKCLEEGWTGYSFISLEEAKTFTKEWLNTYFGDPYLYNEGNMPNLIEGII